MTGVIMQEFPKMRQSSVFFWDRLGDLKPSTKLVAVDDGAYSGFQMERILRFASRSMNKSNIHMFVGFTTSIAQSKLNAIGIGGVNSGQVIPTIRELLEKEPLPRKNELMKLISEVELFGYPTDDVLLDQSLLLLEYRVPDPVSFPGFLASGVIIGAPSAKRIPFIERGQPPYKAIRYMDPS